ncbi:MAG: CHAD domain-containing protein [Planctomycetota bacterium]
MKRISKWIEGVTADSSVGEAAKRSLQQRLEAVEYFLPLAAEQAAEDVEYVHQLRVSTRRAMAALDLYAVLLPKKRAKRLGKALHRIRRAAGKARDLDVLIERHAAEEGEEAQRFVERLQQQRAAAQKPIVATYTESRSEEKLHRRISSVLIRIREREAKPANRTLRKWARPRLKKATRQFVAAACSDTQDVKRLHRFRIAGKHLRYQIELLAPAFPSALRRDIYPIVGQLQQRLGEINDHVVAQGRFARWADRARSECQATYMQALLQREAGELDIRLEQFASWWTEEREQQLQAAIRDVLQRAKQKASAE